MQKLLIRIQSGRSLFVLLLMSLSVFFSFSFKNSLENTLVRKDFTYSTLLNKLTIPTLELTNDAEFEVEEMLNLRSLQLLTSDISFLQILTSLNSFEFFKSPLLYFLIAIPPPRF